MALHGVRTAVSGAQPLQSDCDSQGPGVDNATAQDCVRTAQSCVRIDASAPVSRGNPSCEDC
jgi:hypothetical protein